MNPTYGSGVGALAMLLLFGTSARGTNHEVLIQEVLGACGDSRGVQFVEISFLQGQNHWAGCTRLEFRDAHGQAVGTLEFTTNPPDPQAVNFALVATAEFAGLPGAPRPDFVMPPLVATPAGEVCFLNTGGPGCFPVSACLAYDGAAAGPPPSPRNAAGSSTVLHCQAEALIERGARLFFEETFEGNGRTCGTCHPGAQAFTIGPSFVTTLPPSDPLFIAEAEPALAALERTPLLRGARTLVLENVDGFDRPPVFRGTPHLLNVGGTAPYGLAGDVPDLGTFAAMAVRQHFPRSLARIPGVDFREPTEMELDALEAFMSTIFAGDPGGLDLGRLVLGPAASRGLFLFFGAGRCALCHGGPFLSAPITFDTGVTRRPVNLVPPPECRECPAVGPLEGGRAFDVPTLVGIRDTAPFFHDNSAATLREAVAHYDSLSFNDSPAAQFSGPIALSADDVEDLTAFLEALTACGNGVVDRGEACDDGNVRDGDCCSATCGAAAADGVACDDGDTCTTAAECRDGTCVVVDAGTCSGRGCTDSDPLSPTIITCAVASLSARAPQCLVPGGRIQRKIDRGVRLAEQALEGGASPRARKTLGKAVTAFGRAGRLAFHSRAPGCRTDVVAAARKAKERTLCVRECMARRR